jgi:transcriptional regulator with XRE-family HTH domain
VLEMTFAGNIKELRRRVGLTQAALASACSLSLGVIRDYEQGKREPVLRSALRLARALGVSVEELGKGIEDGAAAAPARKPAGRRKPGRK